MDDRLGLADDRHGVGDQVMRRAFDHAGHVLIHEVGAVQVHQLVVAITSSTGRISVVVLPPTVTVWPGTKVPVTKGARTSATLAAIIGSSVICR